MKFNVASRHSSNFKLRTSTPSIVPAHGFLLVEATLTAVIIAIGFVVITRGISASLKALATIQQYDRLLRLAETSLNELEIAAQRIPTTIPSSGTCEPPDQGYRWELTSAPLLVQPSELAARVRAVTLQVSRVTATAPSVRLRTIWPLEWIAQ